jgi:hypothetical protein
MSEIVDIPKARKIYLAVNLLNLAFYIFFIMRIFNFANVRSEKLVAWPVIIGFIVLLNALRLWAKKVGGGIDNPIRATKVPKILSYSASGLFLAGILLAILVHPMLIWISILCIPTFITAIVISFQNIEKEESELLDDFFEEE